MKALLTTRKEISKKRNHLLGGGVYLDYAATTPVDPQVFAAMQPYFSAKFGNPGSLHSFGQEAIAAVDRSREIIARTIGADFREVIFTGSATEANNFAVRGACDLFLRTNHSGVPATPDGFVSRQIDPHKMGDQARFASEAFSKRDRKLPRVIISAIEHESVAETARDMAREGLVELVEIPVNREGIIDLEKLRDALNEQTVLVSVMYVNNETGVIQPITKISEIIKNFREIRDGRRDEKHFPFSISHFPLLHTDAAQAFQTLACNVDELGADLMTLSAHKIYGPKGAGMLYTRSSRLDDGRKNIEPILTGGGQEFGLRSGTENVPSIVGFARAIELAESGRKAATRKYEELRRYFVREFKKLNPKIQIHGEDTHVSPHILNIFFPKKKAEEVLTYLDLNGVAASSGSACKARSFESSHVIQALGFSEGHARHSIRFSFGRNTQRSDINKVISVIRKL